MNIDIDVLSQLMPNILTVITQLCATAVLFFLMYKLAWKPVKKILDTRSEYEQSRLSNADEMKKKNELLNAEATQQIEEANIQAQQIIARAQEEGQKMRDDLVNEGRQKSRQLVEDAQRNIALEKNRMMEDMHEEVVEIALSAAGKMLQQKLDSSSDRDSIEDFIKEVSGQ